MSRRLVIALALALSALASAADAQRPTRAALRRTVDSLVAHALAEETTEEQAKDEVYEQAKDLVLTGGQASASLIQRRLRVGYPRAARMIERMEEEGLVSAPARDGRREVIGRKGPVGEGEEACLLPPQMAVPIVIRIP